jgi:LemA protein
VQEYAAHEKATLTELTALRTKAMTPGLSPGEKLQVEQQLSSALRGLMVQVEGYPDLKANSNFLHLQQSLHETEEQIMAARRAYNAAVTHYNNRVQGFPGSIFAAMFGFRPENVLRTAEAEKGNVNVKNLFRT